MSDESSNVHRKPEESAWTYKGHRLKSSEFVSSMAHEFRAEIQRTNVWRTRLDATTNWAIVVTGASISIAFSQPNVHHGVIMLNTLLITLFLFIEARRYRFYELWNYRVRLMETDFFAAMLKPPVKLSAKWAENLAENVLHFNSPISLWEAVGLRLRRNYLWIFVITIVAWFAKYWLFPVPATDLTGFFRRAAIGPISGPIVVSLSFTYFVLLSLVAMFTLGTAQVTGEIAPHSEKDLRSNLRTNTKNAARNNNEARTWFGWWQRPEQFLLWIVTNKTDAVAKRIMSVEKRGVTAIPGKESTVLVCVVIENNLNNLDAAIAKEDPQAVINVLPVREVLGKGFDVLSSDF